MKYEKEFRKDHPETVGETDSYFDLSNYCDWLEKKLKEASTSSNTKSTTCPKSVKVPCKGGCGKEVSVSTENAYCEVCDMPF